MGIPRETLTTDEPRRTGLKVRPSLNQRLTALAMLDGRHTSELLNEAIAEYVSRRQAGRRRPASGPKSRPVSA